MNHIDKIAVFFTRYKWHFVFWFCYFWVAYFSDLVIDKGTTLIGDFLFFTTQNIYLFYGSLFLLKNFSLRPRKKFLNSIGILLIILAVYLCIRYIVRFYILATFVDKQFGEQSIGFWLTTAVLWIIYYFFIASAYFYFQTSIKKQKELLKTQEEKALKEQERLQAEHALHTKEQERLQLENIALRAQINPHFLYNTLGFLYSKALPYSDELSDGIMRLSEMMQYSIKPHDASGRVCLEDEIAHIENVLEINKLRFNQSIYIDFIYEGSLTNAKIVPLILLTLVENVLKHGQLNEPEYPATIHLKLEGRQLTFITHNKKRSGPKEHSTSIGLNNTRKRLESTYGQHFSLTTKEQGDYFTAMLVINNICQAAA